MPHISEVVSQIARELPDWHADEPHPDPLVTSCRLIHNHYPDAKLHFLHFDEQVKVTGEFPEPFTFTPFRGIVFRTSDSVEKMVVHLRPLADDYLTRYLSLRKGIENWRRYDEALQRVQRMLQTATGGEWNKQTLQLGETRIMADLRAAVEYGADASDPEIELHIYKIPLSKVVGMLENLKGEL